MEHSTWIVNVAEPYESYKCYRAHFPTVVVLEASLAETLVSRWSSTLHQQPSHHTSIKTFRTSVCRHSSVIYLREAPFAMANYLASIFGTEQDKVGSSFHPTSKVR